MVCNLAQELPIAPVHSYFLCDSWYTAGKVMDSFIKRGFYTIGALKTNRIIRQMLLSASSQWAIASIMSIAMRVSWMVWSMQWFWWPIQRMPFTNHRHCEHFYAQILLWARRKSWPIIKSVGALKFTSVSARQDWPLTNAKFVVLRASKDSGSSHLLPITFVVWLQAYLCPLMKDIAISKSKSSRRRSSSYTNVVWIICPWNNYLLMSLDYVHFDSFAHL